MASFGAQSFCHLITPVKLLSVLRILNLCCVEVFILKHIKTTLSLLWNVSYRKKMNCCVFAGVREKISGDEREQLVNSSSLMGFPRFAHVPLLCLYVMNMFRG